MESNNAGHPEGLPTSGGDLPLFPNIPTKDVVDAATGRPVGPDAHPDTLVVPAEYTGRRQVVVPLGNLVTEGKWLGDAPEGVVETASGGVVYVNPIGEVEPLTHPDQQQ